MENRQFETFENVDKINGNPNNVDTNIALKINDGNKKLDQVADKLGADSKDRDSAKEGANQGVKKLLASIEKGEYSNPQIGEALSNLGKLMTLSQNFDSKNMLGDVGGSNEKLKSAVGEILNTPTDQLSSLQLT